MIPNKRFFFFQKLTAYQIIALEEKQNWYWVTQPHLFHRRFVRRTASFAGWTDSFCCRSMIRANNMRNKMITIKIASQLEWPFWHPSLTYSATYYIFLNSLINSFKSLITNSSITQVKKKLHQNILSYVPSWKVDMNEISYEKIL